MVEAQQHTIWSGVSGGLQSPTITCTFSPTVAERSARQAKARAQRMAMPSRQPFADATNAKVNQPAVPSKPAKAEPVAPVADDSIGEMALIGATTPPPSHAVWDEWEAKVGPVPYEETPLSPEIEAAVEESWSMWEAEAAPGEMEVVVGDGLSLETDKPLRALLSGAALLAAYILVVAVAMGWTFFPVAPPPAVAAPMKVAVKKTPWKAVLMWLKNHFAPALAKAPMVVF